MCGFSLAIQSYRTIYAVPDSDCGCFPGISGFWSGVGAWVVDFLRRSSGTAHFAYDTQWHHAFWDLDFLMKSSGTAHFPVDILWHRTFWDVDFLRTSSGTAQFA